MQELLTAPGLTRISRTFVRAHRVQAWTINYWLRASRSIGRCANISRCGRRITDGFSRTMVSRRAGGAWRAGVYTSAAAAQSHAAAGKFSDVLRTRHAELHAPPKAAVPPAVRPALRAGAARGTGIRKPVYAEGHGRHELATASDRAGPFL